MALREVARIDLYVIRGDTLRQDVSFCGWEDVLDDPDSYEGRLVFRAEQNDAAPELLALTSPVEVLTPELASQRPTGVLSFTADPTQTQALPPYDTVHFVELRALTGDYIARLFQGQAFHGD